LFEDLAIEIYYLLYQRLEVRGCFSSPAIVQ